MENKSKFFNLNSTDVLKGLIMTVLGAILTSVYQLIQTNGDIFNWVTMKPILLTAIGTGIAYLLKNVFTNSDDTFLKKES